MYYDSFLTSFEYLLLALVDLAITQQFWEIVIGILLKSFNLEQICKEVAKQELLSFVKKVILVD